MNMAVSEYLWQDATQEDIEKCLRWCQNRMNLRDWEIDLDYGNKKPKSIVGKAEAGVYCYPNQLKAVIWLPLTRLKKLDSNPYDALMHEALHIMTFREGFSEEHSEIISYRVSAIYYALYMMSNGVELAQIKQGC